MRILRTCTHEGVHNPAAKDNVVLICGFFPRTIALDESDKLNTLTQTEDLPRTGSQLSKLTKSFHAHLTRGGHTTKLTEETQRLLKVRLEAAGVVLSVPLLLIWIRGLIFEQAGGAGGLNLLLMLSIGTITGVLQSRLNLSLRVLRGVELFFIGPATVFLTGIGIC